MVGRLVTDLYYYFRNDFGVACSNPHILLEPNFVQCWNSLLKKPDDEPPLKWSTSDRVAEAVTTGFT
jgi:hypothetical protein